ncbi:TIGR00725 family protein [Desulfuromonas versatilis]|uniref:TIGR00725 family protein n=1 Tax=Desulfuromonas versatilis TaxID=2802975 RepID=A0ABM8HUA8_9BACT|nr:TIGR00725 family protein [Desulfuromonas versatilis]BCR05588.1 TIGR00725 family protein [Desulfuromonas versatilis]
MERRTANPKPRLIIGVIGAANPSEQGYAAAREVGRRIAEAGAVLVCGGLGGVMEAACRGCVEAGGETLGILPGAGAEQANPWVTLAVPTNMGHARNVIIAHTARALIAVEGEFGTLSEMAIGLKLERPVAALGSWPGLPGAVYCDTPEQAVRSVLERLGCCNDHEGG